MNVLIVDDDPLIGLALRHFLEKVDPAAQATHATDGATALRLLAGQSFDLLFLDLDLPEIGGPDVLQALPTSVPVILITAHTDFAARSYEFNVLDYLVKPIEFPRFHRAWLKFLDLPARASGPDPKTIVVRDGTRLVPLPLDRLLFLEAESNYTRFVTFERVVLILVSLKQLESSLPRVFLRVHRSYIVNTQHIEQIEGATLKIGAHKVPIGETYREDLLKRFSPVN